MASFIPTTLPRELLAKVFDGLSCKEKLMFSHLNKEWSAYFEVNPWIWEVVDFTSEQLRHIGTDQVEFYVAKARYGLRCLRISGIHDRILSIFLPHLTKLVELSLWDVKDMRGHLAYIASRLPTLKRLTLCGDIDGMIPAQFLQDCPLLESASIEMSISQFRQHVPNRPVSPTLRHLSIRITSGQDGKNRYLEHFMDTITGQAFGLRTLSISTCWDSYQPEILQYGHLSNLEELELGCCGSLQSLRLPPNLRKLYLPLEDFVKLPPETFMPRLEILGVSFVQWNYSAKYSQAGRVMEAVFQQVRPCLKELGLKVDWAHMKIVPVRLVLYMIGILLQLHKIANIMTLGFGNCATVRDEELHRIVELCPKLENFCLHGCEQEITDDGVRMFVKKLPALKRLSMSEALTDEMIQWLQERKVSVTSVCDYGHERLGMDTPWLRLA